MLKGSNINIVYAFSLYEYVYSSLNVSSTLFYKL